MNNNQNPKKIGGGIPFNEDEIRINEELYDYYQEKLKKCSSKKDEDKLAYEFAFCFNTLNCRKIESIYFEKLPHKSGLSTYTISDSTRIEEILKSFDGVKIEYLFSNILRPKSGEDAKPEDKELSAKLLILDSIRELLLVFIREEVKRMFIHYRKENNTPFVLYVHRSLKKSKSRFFNLSYYYEDLKAYDWIFDDVFGEEEIEKQGRRKKLSTVINNLVKLRKRYEGQNPSRDDIRLFLDNSKMKYTYEQISDIIDIYFRPNPFRRKVTVDDFTDEVAFKTGQYSVNAENKNRKTEEDDASSYFDDPEMREAFLEIIKQYIDRLYGEIAPDNDNLYIIYNYYDDNTIIKFGNTRIPAYELFDYLNPNHARQTLDEIASALGNPWTPQGVEHRYKVLLESINANIDFSDFWASKEDNV